MVFKIIKRGFIEDGEMRYYEGYLNKYIIYAKTYYKIVEIRKEGLIFAWVDPDDKKVVSNSTSMEFKIFKHRLEEGLYKMVDEENPYHARSIDGILLNYKKY